MKVISAWIVFLSCGKPEVLTLMFSICLLYLLKEKRKVEKKHSNTMLKHFTATVC